MIFLNIYKSSKPINFLKIRKYFVYQLTVYINRRKEKRREELLSIQLRVVYQMKYQI